MESVMTTESTEHVLERSKALLRGMENANIMARTSNNPVVFIKIPDYDIDSFRELIARFESIKSIVERG